MHAEVGYSDNPDSSLAGRQAAEQAVGRSGRSDPCDLIFLFCTARHDQRVLREAVSAAAGTSVPIYGGGAVGVITNDKYGYAGDQVGVACLWLDGVSCDILTDGGLLASERDTGFRLGRGLSGFGINADSPVMLFYEAIGQNDASGIRMLMATWILEGLVKALGFQPNLAGAGLMGDHACNPTGQYTGGGMGEHSAMAFAFGGDIHMDSVVMRGCRPASGYYTVTKADGPVILEINHKPALTFMDEFVGPAVKPEQYPFFLLFGINSGERWGEYDEEKYASRLCLGIDRERGGIVMFEPDMVAGTEFQLMFRSSDLDYMRPKFESAFRGLRGRKPVFAMYIDCAGRCAGYGGSDVEDALALQQAVAGRVPVLGIYTGVEIAEVAGCPRGLDLTGVFCLFSQGEGEDKSAGEGGAILEDEGAAIREDEGERKAEKLPAARASVPDMPKPSGIPETLAAPETSASPETPAAPEILAFPAVPAVSGMPIEFATRLCEQNAAKVLALDTQVSALRYELELKRRGFRLLSELAVSLRQTEDYRSVFVQVAQRVNAALNMQKTVVLLSGGDGKFMPLVLQGFGPEEQLRLREQRIRVPDELLRLCPAVVTLDNCPECFVNLRDTYALPSFVASPVYLQGEASALLLTGRTVVQEPYLTRLGGGDMETVQSITELLGSVLVRLQLADITVRAQTDGLTGLWNRNAFQHMVETYLNGEKDQGGAFMMIDVDYFKSVNDTYGHIAGDHLLQACAETMRGVLRDSDIIGRLGGDEFVVFCKGIRVSGIAQTKAAQLADAWRSIIPEGGTKHITASIGVALSPRHGETFQELYNNADAALYKAKELGRDRYTLFEPNP